MEGEIESNTMDNMSKWDKVASIFFWLVTIIFIIAGAIGGLLYLLDHIIK